ncbi:gene transfer agent family protein [Pseudophaeobacter leonis]|uniref:gene transfer agent family protein n=1 Tax=Pseudophaeobacter leonis TaxID=1144477 RepID=UPI0009F3EA32|nr:gene transfer agent family protein [Pseudophaeobacter leonis]
MNLTHTAFFGDGEHNFALTDDMVTELERIADLGIGALYLRCVNMQFTLSDLVEVIRFGLIGGGSSPEQAARLTDTYGRNRPIDELYPLALDILDARWGGAVEDGESAE